MQTFVLFGTSACHLCDQAKQLLVLAQEAGADFQYREEDIALQDSLFERYGELIPVLRKPNGDELNWPFEAAELWDFLVS